MFLFPKSAEDLILRNAFNTDKSIKIKYLPESLPQTFNNFALKLALKIADANSFDARF